jgi:hypothetical protein
MAGLFNFIIAESSQALRAENSGQDRTADLLRESAYRLQANGSRRENAKANRLLEAAEIYSSQPRCDSARKVAIELAKYLEEHFGNRMYGTTATIVSVALERNVTTAAVRSWCSRPMLKLVKTTS